MEEERDGVKAVEDLSLSELDRGFVTDCSLSALPIQMDPFKPLKIVVEYSEAGPALPPLFDHSLNVLSPLNVPNKTSLLSPSTTLTACSRNLVEGKSSTPYERVKFLKPILVSSLDLSSIDLTTSHPSWEVSQIRPSVESPKLESTWSPSYQSVPQTLAEISSLICSGTPLGKSAIEEFPERSTFQDSSLHHAVLELAEEQRKGLAQNMTI